MVFRNKCFTDVQHMYFTSCPVGLLQVFEQMCHFSSVSLVLCFMFYQSVGHVLLHRYLLEEPHVICPVTSMIEVPHVICPVTYMFARRTTCYMSCYIYVC